MTEFLLGVGAGAVLALLAIFQLCNILTRQAARLAPYILREWKKSGCAEAIASAAEKLPPQNPS